MNSALGSEPKTPAPPTGITRARACILSTPCFRPRDGRGKTEAGTAMDEVKWPRLWAESRAQEGGAECRLAGQHR